MKQNGDRREWLVAKVVLLAMGAVVLLFLWQGRDGFNLWDEGYLWYGVQRVLAGEIPVRDFQAYDPARYYWSAAWLGIFNDGGIVALRASIAIFQVLGLAAGLALVGRSVGKCGALWWVLALIILTLWMFPRHKLFDASVSIFLIGALTFLVERPLPLRYFLTGLTVGVVATFGRNHAIYGVAGSVGAMIYLTGNDNADWRQGPLKWAAGVALGYSPVLLLLAIAPGFADAFWWSIFDLIERKETNISLPIPWPWLVPLSRDTVFNNMRAILVGFCFVAVLAYAVVGLICVVWCRMKGKRIEAAFVASACLALPYAHYAYSRSDVGHLALGIFPFVVGSLVLLSTRAPWIKWTLGLTLGGTSLAIMLPLHPGWSAHYNVSWIETSVKGDRLKVSAEVKEEIELIERLCREFAPGNRTFLATPFIPGAYALMNRKSPAWEIYTVTKRSENFQQDEIKRIQAVRPGFVLILDLALDGREDLRFRNSHAVMDRYIRNHFNPLYGYTNNRNFEIFTSEPISE